jgi:hypothetical protein
MFLGSAVRLAREAENLTAIYGEMKPWNANNIVLQHF